MSETNTVTRSTAPHMIKNHHSIKETPNKKIKKNKKSAHQSSQQTPMPTQPHGQEEQ